MTDGIPPLDTVLITRVVTCYKQWNLIELWLGEAKLFSPWIEWVIVDDCPTSPPSGAVLALLRSNGIKLQTPAFNLGRSRARNLGASVARGDWLEIIDGDDVPLPLERDWFLGQGDLLLFPVHEFLEGANVSSGSLKQRAQWGQFLPALSPIDVRPASIVWRRHFFNQLLGFDGRFEGAEDFELMLRANFCHPRVERFSRAKQAYSVRGVKISAGRIYIEGHYKVFEILSKQQSQEDSSSAAQLFLGKESVNLLRIAFGLFILNFRFTFRYFRARLRSGLFRQKS